MDTPLALQRLREQRLISVIRAASPAVALSSANAVAKGGIVLVEITFTVPDAPRVMAELKGRTDLVMGAGTVLTAAQAEQALAAGARFIVAPNLSLEVARVARDAGVMSRPPRAHARPAAPETACHCGSCSASWGSRSRPGRRWP